MIPRLAPSLRAAVLTVALGLSTGGLCACAPRAARFTDRPPVTSAGDDAPIAVPRYRQPPAAFFLSDAYVRRTVVDALDPSRFPEPGDINALDDVARSTWFRPGPLPKKQDGEVGRPIAPLSLDGEPPHAARDALAVRDARGHRYELVRDSADRPEMRTGAAIVASELVRGLGYLAPDAWIVTVSDADLRGDAAPLAAARAWLAAGSPAMGGRYRVAAVRWAPGVDVGTTPVAEVRPDDPNDRVAHRDRRTLRALKVVAAWLRITRLLPENLRDVYVGDRGAGHLEHYLVGLDGALGADAVVGPEDVSEALPGTPLTRLVTLGLTREPVVPTQRRWLALGDIDERVSLGRYSTTPPFEPMDRCSAADAYWAAKRIASVSRAMIDPAIDRAFFTDPLARDRLAAVLVARRDTIVREVFAAVTPLEVVRETTDALELRDEAIARRDLDPSAVHYEARFLDDAGAPIAERATPAHGAAVTIPLRLEGVDARDYVVLRITALRGRERAPRPFEAHLRRSGGRLHLVGVRH